MGPSFGPEQLYTLQARKQVQDCKEPTHCDSEHEETTHHRGIEISKSLETTATWYIIFLVFHLQRCHPPILIGFSLVSSPRWSPHWSPRRCGVGGGDGSGLRSGRSSLRRLPPRARSRWAAKRSSSRRSIMGDLWLRIWFFGLRKMG